MSSTRAIFLTARREVRERLRSRAFMISTAVQFLLLAGVIGISAVAGGGPETVRVAVAGDQGRAIAEAARARQGVFDLEIELTRVADRRAAREAVRKGRADIALADGRLLTSAEPEQQHLAAVQSAVRAIRVRERLRSEGLSEDEARQVLRTAPLEQVEVEGAVEEGRGLALAGSLLLYIAIFTAGLQVASGIVEEKGSRVVELVLAAIRPHHLLAGKILGLGLTGVLQLAAVVGLGLALALGTGEIELPASTASTAALVAVYFALGYLFYACAFAAAAALVSRQEDTQTTTAPMTVTLIASYLVSIAALNDPSGTLARASTFLPPVAPLVVPARAARDALPGWELALSVAVMAAGILLLVLVAGRIYERTVLRLGAPVALREALRLGR